MDSKMKASGEESHAVTASPTTISSLPTIDKSINNNLNPMTLPYNLNLNWVSPIITALSLSASSSILNLNTELATTTTSPSSSSTLLSCIPQMATKLRASSCFSLGRSSNSSFATSFHHPPPPEMKLNTSVNVDSTTATSSTTNKDNGENDDEKPLDLSVKSLLTNQPAREMNLTIENLKTSSRRKLSKPRSQATMKPSMMTTTMTATPPPTTINTPGISYSPEQDVNNIKAFKEPQPESIPPMNTDKNGIELSQQWKLDIQNLVHLTESNQKRQKSTTHRRPFKAFGNSRIPSITKEILLKSTELVDPLLLASSIEENTSEAVENTEQKCVTLTPPTSSSITTNDIDNTVSMTNTTSITDKDHSRRKSSSKGKSRRSQSTSAIIPLGVASDTDSKAFPTLSTTKSLESLINNKTDQLKEIIITTPSIASISSTPSCYSSSYPPELIDIEKNSSSSTVECNPRMRRFPEMTPKEIKDKAYWEKRVKNNEAARRSRRARKTKELSLKKYADNLEKVNMKLIEEIELLKAEIIQLKAEKEAHNSS
ncbi:unnamed protein product [Trichobilharzia szidati]|nr:unnamed protein product [Trichobilharzia szidati]